MILDEVAKFHFRNGAYFYRINWIGSDNEQTIQASAGLMANYVYQLKFTNDSNFECRTYLDQDIRRKIIISPTVNNILS
jgi:hypothetical protein